MTGAEVTETGGSATIEVQIACGDAAEADRIADALVGRRFAACVQQVPIRSTYRWEGEVQRDEEVLLLAKTTSDRIDDVTSAVLELHSYDVPAVTAVAIVAGSGDYLDWVATETT